MADDTSKRRIKSLERADRIVEQLRSTNGATLTEIANGIGVTPSTAHTYLATLAEMGYIVKTGDQYRLGPEFLTLGEYVRHDSRLYAASKQEVEQLAERTGEAVHLVIEHRGRGIALYEQFGPDAIGTQFHQKLRQQPHQHLHCTASGKAILASLPEDRTNEILDEHGLQDRTPNTITDRATLFEEFETIREQGYAVNDGEELPGIAAIGVPVRDRDQTVLGSIAVSVPKSRMNQDTFSEDVIQLLKRTANSIEVDLQTTAD